MQNNIIMADKKGGEDLLSKRIANTLESYTIPNDSIIGFDAFHSCTALTNVTFPENVTFVSGSSFLGTRLETVHVHNATCAGDNHFRGITSLRTFVGENIIWPETARLFYFLYDCTELKTLDINIRQLAQDFLGGCMSLDTVILRKSDGLTTINNDTFSSTKFKNGGAGGTIYIPKVLFDHLGDGTSLDYKAAPGWSIFDGYGTITWAQIEGSIYETQYADGTPISTGG